jgi:cobalt-zinc-cadmium efflux system outer membrane protein
MDSRDRRRGFAAYTGGRFASLAFAGAAAATLGACAHFTAAPLPEGPDLAASASQLSVDVARVRLAPLPPRQIDPARGVDPIDAAILAVLNSPDLAAKRAAAHVAAAQTFSAGLLPDPTVPLSTDIPDDMKANVIAFAVTPTIDISALITRSATLHAARAAEKQTNLDLLWSEWSTAQQARQYAVTVLMDDQKAAALAKLDAELSERARQSGIALSRHDVTGAVASADLAAKLDADVQLAATQVAADRARRQLNALIGLAPDARLPLVDSHEPHDPEPAKVQSALAALPKRRPDLLALQAGYESQNGNLRRSILAQFPLLNLGYSRQRDTSNIYTNGAAGTVTLPIFNRNRGDIAIQRATRERLAQEYRARLDQTMADVAQAQADLAAQQAALVQFEVEVPRLEAEADLGRPAFARRDLDSAAYLAIEQAVIKEVVAMWDTRLAQRLADIGLETVLFLPPAEVGRP